MQVVLPYINRGIMFEANQPDFTQGAKVAGSAVARETNGGKL